MSGCECFECTSDIQPYACVVCGSKTDFWLGWVGYVCRPLPPPEDMISAEDYKAYIMSNTCMYTSYQKWFR